MTAEELWEKKEVIGIIAILAFFVIGLVFVANIRSTPPAWGILEDIHRRGSSIHYDVLVRSKKDGNRLFRERVINPKRKLATLKEKRPGDEFPVRIKKTDVGWEIAAIPPQE